MLRASRGGLLACVLVGAACTYDPNSLPDGVETADASILPDPDGRPGGESGAGGSAGQGGGGPNGGSGPSGGAAGRDAGNDAGNDADSGPPDAEAGAGCGSLIAVDGGCVQCAENWHCADDGDPCNGVEFCASDGSCASTGDPCSGQGLVCLRENGECVQCTGDSFCRDGELCDPTAACVECVADGDCTEPSEPYCRQGTCVECSVDEQCGATDCGDFSPCTFEGGVCDETGSQAQTCVVPVCVEGACSSTSHENSQECGRSTEGSLCEGGTTCDGFGACEFASECSETGEQSRTCRDRSCAGGSCNVTARTETRTCTRETDGDTCEGGTTCDGFGSCGGFSNTCDETGTQSRSCTDRSCSAGSCNATPRLEEQSCTRDVARGTECNSGGYCDGRGECLPCLTDDHCGVSDCGEFSPCAFEGGLCDETGSQTQTCVVPVCTQGACSSTPRENRRGCVRSTEGERCADAVCATSQCEYEAGVCDETGSQTRQCNVFQCSEGSCVPRPTTETLDCARDTEGTLCEGGTTCDGFGACEFASECSETGEQSRTCRDRSCAGGRCRVTTRTETRSCTRDTDGNTCEGGTTCGGFGSCDGFSSSCDETGTQSRSCTDKACSAGRCSRAIRTEQQSCERDTDGDSCGATTCGAFGSCGGFSNTCDETGTQSRSCTDRACSAGSCSNSTRTEQQSCTRNTEGNTCDDGLFCNGAETCNGFGSCVGGVEPCASGFSCDENENHCCPEGTSGPDCRPTVGRCTLLTSGNCLGVDRWRCIASSLEGETCRIPPTAGACQGCGHLCENGECFGCSCSWTHP